MLHGKLPVGDFRFTTSDQWLAAVCTTNSISLPLPVWINDSVAFIEPRLNALLRALLDKEEFDRITGDQALANLRL